MKIRNSLIVIFTSVVILSFGYYQNANALCMPNQDWPDAPCYGCPSCYPGLEQEKLAWEAYYDHKGPSWMTAKKLQLDQAIRDNSLREWFKQDDAHKNVHKYYFLHGNVPHIYGMTFDEMLGFEHAWDAVEINSPDAPLLLWNYHDIILDGAIVESDLAIMVTGEDVPLHHLKVNKYFKGERTSELISAVDNFGDLKFELFENGLFYLKKLENQNLYTVTVASIPTFGTCDARDLIEISPVLPNEKPPRSMPVGDIGIDPCVPDYFDVDPDGQIVDTQTSEPIPEPEQDIPIHTDCGEGTTYQDGLCVEDGTKENSADPSNCWGGPACNYEIMLPLKQTKLGIPVEDMQCKENLVLIQKHDNSFACVKPSTVPSLSQREWGIERESLVKLVENSDAIITGMVVGEDNRPNGERHIWLGSYEWLKQGKYDDQQLFLEQTISRSGNGFFVPFERGEEVLLFLKNGDVKRGAYDLVDFVEMPAQKYPIKLRDAVVTFFDHEFFYQNINDYDINENHCTEKFLEDDSYYYCTTKSESHVPVEKLTERIKEKILENVSSKYFEEHFDLKIVSDEPDAVPEPEPNSGPHTLPAKASGQNIRFALTIDGLDFNYFMKTTFEKSQNQMHLHYHPPKEIKSIVNTEDEVDKLIYSCLDNGMYKFPWTPFHISYHAEDGLNPVIEGHGPPTVYDRWGDTPVQDREKVFRIWLATGKVDCADIHQEFVPENKMKREKVLLFDSSQLENID